MTYLNQGTVPCLNIMIVSPFILLQETTSDALKGRKYLDFLDILLTAKDENGEGMSLTDIRNEVDTFLFEGNLL